MFAPTKVWRKWHKKINHNQRRYATASALAGMAFASLYAEVRSLMDGAVG
jgi:large subunit ribosomal protein L4e